MEAGEEAEERAGAQAGLSGAPVGARLSGGAREGRRGASTAKVTAHSGEQLQVTLSTIMSVLIQLQPGLSEGVCEGERAKVWWNGQLWLWDWSGWHVKGLSPVGGLTAWAANAEPLSPTPQPPSTDPALSLFRPPPPGTIIHPTQQHPTPSTLAQIHKQLVSRSCLGG